MRFPVHTLILLGEIVDDSKRLDNKLLVVREFSFLQGTENMNIIDMKEGSTTVIMPHSGDDSKKGKNPVAIVLQYLQDVVQVHGSVPRVAEMLGVSKQSVYNWLDGKSLPQGDNIDAIIKLYAQTLPEMTGKETDAIMAIREVADTYAMEFDFSHALATQGQIYLRKVDNGRVAVCRARDPHYPTPDDAFVVYADHVCSWARAMNEDKFILHNVDGTEMYIMDELPSDIVIGEMITGFRPRHEH